MPVEGFGQLCPIAAGKKPEWTLFLEVSVSRGDSSLSSVLFELCSNFLAGPLAISRSSVLWRPERTGGSWCIGLLETWSAPSTSPMTADSFKCARKFLFEDTWNEFRPFLLFFPQHSLTGGDQANHSHFCVYWYWKLPTLCWCSLLLLVNLHVCGCVANAASARRPLTTHSVVIQPRLYFTSWPQSLCDSAFSLSIRHESSISLKAQM